MTPLNLAPGKRIDELIRRQCSFALYRIPGEETPRFLMQREGAVRTVGAMTELNEQRGFVIAPFQASDACPIVLIEPDVFSLDDIDWEGDFAVGPTSTMRDLSHRLTRCLSHRLTHRVCRPTTMCLASNFLFVPYARRDSTSWCFLAR